MTHLLLKQNMLKRGSLCSCIIALAIYAVRCQFTDFVPTALPSLKPNTLAVFPFDCFRLINNNLNSEKSHFLKFLFRLKS